jgi:sulfur transfer complex TusBCD TusB component (DsrH family)
MEVFRDYAIVPVFAILYFLFTLTAFCLAFFDRADRVYLWLGGVYLIATLSSIVSAIFNFTQSLSFQSGTAITDVFLPPLSYAGWVMVWWFWFRLRRPAWMPGVACALAVLVGISNMLAENLWFTMIPQPVSAVFHIVSMVARLTFLAISLWIVTQGIRLHGIEGWLVLPCILLGGINRFWNELASLGIVLIWFPFGLQFSLGQLSSFLLIVVLALLLLRRLNISLKRQRQMALDVKQAQEVQQVILPPARMTLPGLEIESEYRPALEVGGDFFQIIPHPTDGSVLIVAGDVAGKGLRSGMLVALLVGAIRSTSELNADPAIVLGALNRRLLGRGDAQATCLALWIDASGAATLVNAGHLPPYLNGVPLAMEGALPLGMLPGAVFSVMNFKLAEGDRLLLLSDGIAEARDADGQLYGFERVAQLLQTHPSAADLAAAAQRYGQQDDISVISVTRTAARG